MSRTVLLLVLLMLSACFGGGNTPLTTATASSSIIPGTDGAPAEDRDVSGIPDAVPKAETITRAGNKNPYTVFGKTYQLLPQGGVYRAQGTASWYGTKFHGRKTANGETYDMYGMTAAHKTLPIPSYVKVTNLKNQRSVIVRVNDRGPFHGDRIIDLSYAAAKKLDYSGVGTARVEVEAIDPGDYQRNSVERPHITTRAEQTPEAQLQSNGPRTPLLETSSLEIGAFNTSTEQAIEPYHLPGNTFLQVGAFASFSAAQTLRGRVAMVTAQPIAIREASYENGKLFRVLIGPFSSVVQLRNIRESLIQIERLSPFVVYDTLH